MGHVVDLKMAASGDEQPNPDAPTFSFDDFWKAYPRRVAKKDAQKSWARIHAEDYPQIFASIAAFKRTEGWRKENGRFIPMPATWLNGERWTDELESDLTMGVCCWNQNGTREPGKPRCSKSASKEKNGVVYCSDHASRVN